MTRAVAIVVDEDDFLPGSVEQLKKKKMHNYMLQDPWKIRNEKLKTMDVLFTQAERAHRLEKKSHIRKYILNGIKDMVEKASTIKVGQEFDSNNHCQ